ncbi:hypothetical protein EJ110_NYTH50934 [Nymphaea thermarum]|nr:hypothetical protein EJ110_NYTH50934 [Nymphaea thermarum]
MEASGFDLFGILKDYRLIVLSQEHVEQENVVPDFQNSNMSAASWPTDAVLVNSHELLATVFLLVIYILLQFYKWFTDLESATKSEWEEKYRQYVSTLKQRIQTCDEVLSQVYLWL